MEQSNYGDNSILIQQSGDGNVVTISLSEHRLSLHRRHRTKAEPRTIRDLLLTEFRLTEFVGRDHDFNLLKSWLDADDPISAHCITGEGGSGKTSLGIELWNGLTGKVRPQASPRVKISIGSTRPAVFHTGDGQRAL